SREAVKGMLLRAQIKESQISRIKHGSSRDTS
ncbi:MAG: hypothetical protein ACI93T_003758, partial [Porticoccaceae bacterium]